MTFHTKPASELTEPSAPAPSAPIPDSNGNNVFDRDDLIAALAREELILEQLSTTANSHAANPTPEKQFALLRSIGQTRTHALMHNLEIPDLAETLAQKVETAGKCPPTQLEEVSREITNRLNTLLADKIGAPHQRPAYEKLVRASIPQQMKLFDAEHWITDKLANFDFAHSFDRTFKNGIDIKPQDVVPILGMFIENPERLRPCHR